jgi:hypothetical protein
VVINAVKQVKEVTFLEGELPAGHTQKEETETSTNTCRDTTPSNVM